MALLANTDQITAARTTIRELSDLSVLVAAFRARREAARLYNRTYAELAELSRRERIELGLSGNLRAATKEALNARD